MKLATLDDGTRDGRLLVVSRDLTRWTDAADVAPTLQAALDRWGAVEPALRDRADALEAGRAPSELFDARRLHAPLPRAYEWVDGSAFLHHVELVRKARKAEIPPTLRTDPLVYQGGSGMLLPPTADIPLRDPSWGLDFEAEVVAILGDTPIGTTAHEAGACIRLFTQCNDLTLRNLIPPELAKGFGFFQSKPATAFGPVAVTPDELGPSLRDGRVHARMRVTLNGAVVGETETGPEMHFSFHDLIAHIARTRAYTAGTLLGSGTISNADDRSGYSCLAEQRMVEILRDGGASTRFLQAGDHMRIEVCDADGRAVFGSIDQRVVAA